MSRIKIVETPKGVFRGTYAAGKAYGISSTAASSWARNEQNGFRFLRDEVYVSGRFACVDHEGREFRSVQAMADFYKIPRDKVNILIARGEVGWRFKD